MSCVLLSSVYITYNTSTFILGYTNSYNHSITDKTGDENSTLLPKKTRRNGGRGWRERSVARIHKLAPRRVIYDVGLCKRTKKGMRFNNVTSRECQESGWLCENTRDAKS
jgi:hypothetical protein